MARQRFNYHAFWACGEPIFVQGGGISRGILYPTPYRSGDGAELLLHARDLLRVHSHNLLLSLHELLAYLLLILKHLLLKR